MILISMEARLRAMCFCKARGVFGLAVFSKCRLVGENGEAFFDDKVDITITPGIGAALIGHP